MNSEPESQGSGMYDASLLCVQPCMGTGDTEMESQFWSLHGAPRLGRVGVREPDGNGQ